MRISKIDPSFKEKIIRELMSFVDLSTLIKRDIGFDPPQVRDCSAMWSDIELVNYIWMNIKVCMKLQSLLGLPFVMNDEYFKIRALCCVQSILNEEKPKIEILSKLVFEYINIDLSVGVQERFVCPLAHLYFTLAKLSTQHPSYEIDRLSLSYMVIFAKHVLDNLKDDGKISVKDFFAKYPTDVALAITDPNDLPSTFKPLSALKRAIKRAPIIAGDILHFIETMCSIQGEYAIDHSLDVSLFLLKAIPLSNETQLTKENETQLTKEIMIHLTDLRLRLDQICLLYSGLNEVEWLMSPLDREILDIMRDPRFEKLEYREQTCNMMNESLRRFNSILCHPFKPLDKRKWSTTLSTMHQMSKKCIDFNL